KDVRKVKLPRRKRVGVSRFEKTEEWKLLKADLDAGLKPFEARQISLTEEDKKKYRIKNRRTCARFVQKYLAEHKLPYAVKSFRAEIGNVIMDIIRVEYPKTPSRKQS